MSEHRLPSSFWFAWLLVVSVGVALFGLLLVVAPDLAQKGFALLTYMDTNQISGFGTEAVAYISLAHVVLGSVMFGWGIALFFLIRSQFRQGARGGWFIVTVSVIAWFIPDTAYSLWSGFWQNAVLNTVFMVLFAIPLLATYRTFHETHS
jgi:hypothetical protein